MNPTAFSELLTDIPDEFIVSAANPHSKPVHLHQISAIAACIVLLLAAAVYPKLRMHTNDITEPPASAAESIVTATSAPGQSGTETAVSTVPPAETSVAVTVHTAAKGSETDSAAETAAPLHTGTSGAAALPQTAESTAPPQTAPPAHTEKTEAVTTSPATGDTELTAGPIAATTALMTAAVQTVPPVSHTTADTALTTSSDSTSTETVNPLERARALFEAFIAENHLPARIADETSYPELAGKIVIEWDPQTGTDVEHAILKFVKENNIDGYLFVTVQTAL